MNVEIELRNISFHRQLIYHKLVIGTIDNSYASSELSKLAEIEINLLKLSR